LEEIKMDKALSFNDILKSSFLEKASSFSIVDVAIALGLALAIGLFIFLVYKKTFKGVMYSESFGISLIAMSLVTTLIILAITSNVVLSLGMVGALSIVRFRTAVKEPIWSISVGIVVGAGLIPLAVFGSAFIGIMIMVFANKKSIDNPYILVVSCKGDRSENNAMEYINKYVKKYVVKSKTVSAGSNIELTVEIRLKEMSTQFVNEISSISGVNNAVLVSYNGEYMS